MLTHAKLPLLILASLVIGSIATYSMTPTLTPEALLEIQNKKSVRDCITNISYESWTLEIQTAIWICSKMEVKKITWTVTSAISEVPIWLKDIVQDVRIVSKMKSLHSISPIAQNVKNQSVKTSVPDSVKKKSNILIISAETAEQKQEKKSENTQNVIHAKPTTSSINNYWKAYNIAISQIQKWEWLRLKAYWDHSGYSIWYGSRAKSSTERITKAEADRRLAGLVTQVLGKVQKDFPKLRPEAQGALVSFAYNCHSGYRSILRNGLSYHGQWCKTASWKKLTGLVNRRAEESKLIFIKN